MGWNDSVVETAFDVAAIAEEDLDGVSGIGLWDNTERQIGLRGKKPGTFSHWLSINKGQKTPADELRDVVGGIPDAEFSRQPRVTS